MAQIDSRTTQVNDYTDDILVIKKKVAEVAENKQVSITYGGDDMEDVLDKIDNGTIKTPSGTYNITTNGTYNVTNYASADVNVVPSLQNKSITITENGTQTITADVGYDGLNELEVTTNVSGGGSGTGDYWYKIIDYDGTVFKEGRFNNNDTIDLSTITIPTHSGLIFDGWSSSEPIVNNNITCNNNNLLVGAMYTTESGLTEFDIELTKATGLSVTFTMAGQVDWGDGTIETISSSTTHTYNDYGNYTITCDGNTIPISVMTTSAPFLTDLRVGANVTLIKNEAIQSSGLQTITLPHTINAIQYGSLKANKLKVVILPSNITSVDSTVFQNCYELSTVVIPSGVTSINGTFQDCPNLANVVIPDSVTTITASPFIRNYKISHIVIPNNVTNIPNNCFQGDSGLNNILFKNNSQLTTIGNYAFSTCRALNKITIPNGVTSIGNNAFENVGILLYDFTNCVSIPTLGNTIVFRGIKAICKIVVPDNLYENWIIATNWVNYANYIYKESEVTI